MKQSPTALSPELQCERLNYATIAPQAFASLVAVKTAILASGLDRRLMELVFQRVSQMNGCAHCVVFHGRELRRLGESPERLDSLPAWRESPLFDAREKAALGWAETLTRLADSGAPESLYQAARAHLNDVELVNLSFAITLINSWNRLAVGFRQIPAL